jgi:hypothetical protein
VTSKKAAKKAPAKKGAAKKSAAKKSAAKKIAAKHAEHAERDLRRAYEHMGRLEALRPLLAEGAAGEIEILLRFAQGSLTGNDAKSAAELLRAGEHLAFGSLASGARDAAADERVREAAETECFRLLERAEEHWEEHSAAPALPLERLYRDALKRSEEAGRKGALRRALEFARAAEALAHVEGGSIMLEAGTSPGRLRASGR